MTSTDLTLPSPVPWLTALWRRWFAAAPCPAPAVDYRALHGLSASTLKDIGAPDWMWSAGPAGPAPWEVERARR